MFVYWNQESLCRSKFPLYDVLRRNKTMPILKLGAQCTNFRVFFVEVKEQAKNKKRGRRKMFASHEPKALEKKNQCS